MLKYDDILTDVIGEFGAYQKRCFGLTALLAIPVGISLFSTVFIQAETDHWCTMANFETLVDQCEALFNGTVDCEIALKGFMLPKEMAPSACGDDKWKFSSCHKYDLNVSDVTVFFEPIYGNTSRPIIKCDQGWEYDTSVYKSTFIQEFNLVCDQEFLAALSTSIFLFGSLMGALCCGPVSDRFGRKPTLFGAMILMTVAGVGQTLSPHYAVYIIVRFWGAFANVTIFTQGFILSAEFVGPSRRTFCTVMFSCFYACGIAVVPVFAYFIPRQRLLPLVIAGVPFLYFPYYWVLPESPRWLITVGRLEEAKKIIQKSATVNKVVLPEDMFDDHLLNCHDQGTIKQKSKQITEEDVALFKPLDLFRYPNMRMKTLILFASMSLTCLVYYGVSFNTANLSGNDFVNVAVGGLVEIPSYVCIIYFMESRMGRRYTFFAAAVLVCVFSILMIFTPKCGDFTWPSVLLAMVAKFGTAGMYTISFFHAVELYPTVARSVGSGVTTTCGMIGSMLAPQLLFLGKWWQHLPNLVFSITSLLVGCLVLLLPETRGRKLPDTIEEAEQFGKKRKKFSAV